MHSGTYQLRHSRRLRLCHPEFGVEGISQSITEKIQGQHEEEHGDGGAGKFPPVAEPETLLGVVDDRAPARFAGDADAEITENDLREDQAREAQGEIYDDQVR